MGTEDSDLPVLNAQELAEVKAYNAGVSAAYVKMVMLIHQLDPTNLCQEAHVMLKYLDAWLAEAKLKNNNLEDFAEELEQDSFKKFLQYFGASPEECDIEFAPEVIQEIKKRCSKTIIDFLNNCTDDANEDFDEDDTESDLPEC